MSDISKFIIKCDGQNTTYNLKDATARTNLETVTSTANTNKTDITNLKSSVGTNTNDITSLKSSVSTNSTNISTLQTNYGTLNSKVDELFDKVDFTYDSSTETLLFSKE